MVISLQQTYNHRATITYPALPTSWKCFGHCADGWWFVQRTFGNASTTCLVIYWCANCNAQWKIDKWIVFHCWTPGRCPLSTNFTLANTVSVTTKLTVVWSPVDISVTMCWSNQTRLGLLLFSLSSLSPNDDLPFGEMNPLLCIDALLLIVPTLVAWSY